MQKRVSGSVKPKMHTDDLPQLRTRLKQLGTVFDRPEPSNEAMIIWGEVLHEFTLPEIFFGLRNLQGKISKFPLPSEVFKICSENRADRIEKETEKRAQEKLPRVASFPATSEIARMHAARTATIVHAPRPSRRAWIGKILARKRDPSLSSYAVRLAQDAQALFIRRGE